MNILFFITPKVEVEYLYNYHTIKQAIEKMEYNNYTSIPVIDEKGRYVFTLTEGDLLWRIKKNIKDKDSDINILKSIKINDINKHNKYKTVSVNSDMENIIKLAINQNFIPVVDDQNIFIGIIKRSDIITYFANRINSKEFINSNMRII